MSKSTSTPIELQHWNEAVQLFNRATKPLSPYWLWEKYVAFVFIHFPSAIAAPHEVAHGR